MLKKSQKRKITIMANQLTDVDVQGVSLVKHGATRSPIKLIKKKKSEGGIMHLNLKTLFGITKAEKTPQIVSVICKAEDATCLDAAVAVLEMKVLTKTESEGVITASLVETTEEITVFKMDENIAIGVVDLEKGFSSYTDSTDFMETLLVGGFYPGVRMAQDALTDAIYEIMWQAPAGIQPSEAIGKVLGDFSVYIQGLVSALPALAFKLEKLEKTETKLVEDVQKVENSNSGEIKSDKDIKDSVVKVDSKESVAVVQEPDKVIEKSEDNTGDNALVKDDTGIKDTDSTQGIQKAEDKLNLEEVLAGFTKTITESIVEQVDQRLAKSQEKLDTFFEKVNTRVSKTENDLAGVLPITPNSENGVKETSEPKEAVFSSVLKFEGFEKSA